MGQEHCTDLKEPEYHNNRHERKVERRRERATRDLTKRTKSTDSLSGQLTDYDYTVVIDRSTSMRKKMKGKRITRMQAVEEVVLEVIMEASRFDPDGLTVYTFSHKYDMIDNVTCDDAEDLFDSIKLSAGTVLAPVLEDIYQQHKRKKEEGKDIKGDIVIVIHDGEPDDKDDVVRTLVKMANYVKNDKEMGITFIQAGDDSTAISFLQYLDDYLYKPKSRGGHGAKHDIIDTKSIEWFNENGAKKGFLQALID